MKRYADCFIQKIKNISSISVEERMVFSLFGAERLILADDAELDLFKVYGWWEPDNITKSIFETEEWHTTILKMQ